MQIFLLRTIVLYHMKMYYFCTCTLTFIGETDLCSNQVKADDTAAIRTINIWCNYWDWRNKYPNYKYCTFSGHVSNGKPTNASFDIKHTIAKCWRSVHHWARPIFSFRSGQFQQRRCEPNSSCPATTEQPSCYKQQWNK